MVPGGFLILKIENIKEIENKIDINTELEKVIDFYKNSIKSIFKYIFYENQKRFFNR